MFEHGALGWFGFVVGRVARPGRGDRVRREQPQDRCLSELDARAPVVDSIRLAHGRHGLLDLATHLQPSTEAEGSHPFCCLSEQEELAQLVDR